MTTPTDRLLAAAQRVLDNATDDDPRISVFDWQELKTAVDDAREAPPPPAAAAAVATDLELKRIYYDAVEADDDIYAAHVSGRRALYEAGARAERAANHQLRIRNSEARMLLTRMVKYCREDKATTLGVTRLARLVEQVADYLSRTNDPNDILRSEEAATALGREEGEFAPLEWCGVCTVEAGTDYLLSFYQERTNYFATEAERLRAALATATDATPPPNLPPDWTVWPGVKCVACPACAFTFDSFNANANGTYSCPNCAEQRLEAALATAEAERLTLATALLAYEDGHLRDIRPARDATVALARRLVASKPAGADGVEEGR